MSVEIRISDSFTTELSDVKNAANLLSSGSQLTNSDATDTTREFAARYERVQRLVQAYKELLVSDVEQLEKYVEDMNNLDESLSS